MQPALTLDGRHPAVRKHPDQSDIAAVQSNWRAEEASGLFRTKFLFINRATLPTENEQYKVYHQVAAALKPNPVVIRTLDLLGGDKFPRTCE